MSFSTIPEMFLNLCEKWGDSRNAFLYKEHGVQNWIGINHNQLRDKVESFAIGLLNLGIRSGDRIGIVSENRIEWIIADLAISGIGGVDVPIFPILTAKQEEYIFSNCEIAAIIVSNDFQLGKVMQFKEALPSLRQVIVMNEKFETKDIAVRPMSQIINRANEIRTPQERRAIFEEHSLKVKPDDLLTLIYTSGTTGNPKGVMLTHNNVITNIKGSIKSVGFGENDILLSYLPWCHSYERTTGYYSMFCAGALVAIAESLDAVASNILDVKPTLMTTVPRFMETVKKKVYSKVEKESPAKRKIFYWAVNTGVHYAKTRLSGNVSVFQKLKYNIADTLVLSKIKQRMGGRLAKMVAGGAALPDDVAYFFEALGIHALQGYGLTEASPVVSVNLEDSNEIGTIGKPLYNVEVKIAGDGEILVSGQSVMKGYWNDKEATERAIDSDGWLYTGDVGLITKKGNIKITDRKKDIFVSSGGKNIAPQPIENLLQQSKYIEHAVLIGEKREYCTALLSPNYERLKELADSYEIKYSNDTELISNEKIINHIKKDIDYIQRDLAKFERVRRFSLLSQPFSIENGELSPKLSIRRHVVEKKYAEFIEAMYGD